ncbi:6f5dc488-41cd-4e68-ae94-eb02a11bdd50 [Thermothielavioides terrestris]|uniref:6f5dc488-41cd-4e68-ae94-eb02a11bdd50 n=1 Tax=Thermothielavioides terrestris TaxID=2587410 RepID=A0A3S4D581_9PEZI|nr:6f5dc488-41cd-4e68-ae94-eb02a11bdd50 [Thermothielavioides terrestris]
MVYLDDNSFFRF